MTKAGAIFVNLPVRDLKKSKEFFSALDFEFNELYSDDKAACLILGDNLYTMLLVEKFFKEFTRQEITDTRKANEVITAITIGTKIEVDELFAKAIKAGAKDKTTKIPGVDEDNMYYKRIEDLDGHLWELMMDMDN
ncbi:VOC family protein [Carnobacterium sp.]|uniref:VOC family protein n=1 Tax=Carnobacterium sp. TaxID=48221 RepID=UPI003C762B31